MLLQQKSDEFLVQSNNKDSSHFGNFLSKNLVIGVLKRAHAPLKGVPLNFQCWSGSGSATQFVSSECEWKCHSKNKGVLNPLLITYKEKKD